MQRSVRLDGLDTSTRALRSPSISSDMMSTSGKSLNSSAPFVNPPPAYIAQTEASKLISSETDRNAIVTPPALQLANEFLDHVLFTILAASRSISLSALRAAVPGVLKPRLGKAALRVAEEELKEYLEDEDDVDVNNKKGVADTKFDFDVELAWKLARLRCMVYTRLGDLEEEDEDEWLEREQLPEQINAYGKAKKGDVQMEAPSAIFLTSVIEYLGEQALYYAAQHAQKRHYQQQNSEGGFNNESTATLTPKTDEIILDGKDMNYVGRDSPLSRLWRSWRRNTREFSSRPMSPESALSPMGYSPVHSRTESSGRPFPTFSYYNKAVVVQAQSPSQVPLPISDRDVDEIEIPGLASGLSDSEEEEDEVETTKQKRPASMVHMPGAFPGSFYTAEEHQDSDSENISQQLGRPSFYRQRSMSSPAPVKTPLSKFTPHSYGIDEQLAASITQDTTDEVTKGEEIHEMPADTQNAVTEPSALETSVVQKSIDSTSANLAKSPETQSPSSSAVSPSLSGPPSPIAHRRERLPSNDQVIVNKRAGMIGDEVAAAVGALGAGDAAAAAAAAAAQPERGNLADRRALPKPHRVPLPAPLQKRTVAEEMLGTGSSVPPPKDATTGASITNFADFDSMHIPLQMPPESPPVDEPRMGSMPFAEASPSRLAALTSSLNIVHPDGDNQTSQIGIAQRSTAGKKKIDRDVTDETDETDGLAQPPVVERNRPPIQVPDNSVRTSSEVGYKTTTLVAPAAGDMHSPVSPLPPHEYRSGSPDSNLSSDSELLAPIRQSPSSSNPVQGHSKSKSTLQSHHSIPSSSSSKLLGFTRDAPSRPQTVSQQRTPNLAIDDARALRSPASVNGSKENRLETANSSTNKLLAKSGKYNETMDESKKKSLEVLIQGNETLHYTLTPANVMKSEENMSTVRKRTGTQDMADFLRTTGPPETLSSRTQSSDSPPPPPPKAHEGVTASNIGLAVSSPRRGVIPSSQGIRQSMISPNRFPNPVGLPRDARMEQSSAIRDLADYARSTGPETEDQLPRALSPRLPVSSTFRPNATAGVNRAASVATSKPSNRIKLQARDPRTSRRAETSDLIDFIREGPPRAAGDHRIDRKVAPFRTTMDSEDFNNLNFFDDRESNTKYSEVGSFGERSNGPSINSQTALLNKSSGGAIGLPKNVVSRQQADADDGMPQRTRTRIKDPYAIDYSDDEDMDDEDHARPQKPQRNEESLIDFLRNTAPPPSMAAQPILSARPVKRSPNLGQRSSVLQSNGAREDSPHLTQIGSKMDSYRPTQPTHASHIDRSRAKPKFEARDPTMSKTGTSDLADYLKNTGPPPSAVANPQPFVLTNGRQPSADKDMGGFRVFGKRKGK